MSQKKIENPAINSLYIESACHYRFSDEGHTKGIITIKEMKTEAVTGKLNHPPELERTVIILGG